MIVGRFFLFFASIVVGLVHKRLSVLPKQNELKHEANKEGHRARRQKDGGATRPLASLSSMTQSLINSTQNDSAANQECALLFWGLAKHFKDIVLPSIRKYILEVNPHCDVYAHTTDLKEVPSGRHMSSSKDGKMQETGQLNATEVFGLTKNLLIETAEEAKRGIKDYEELRGIVYSTLYTRAAKDQRDHCVDGVLAMEHSKERVWNMMPKEYKRVGLFRLDVQFTMPIDISEGEAIVPSENKNLGWNDRAFYGSYKWAKVWATTPISHLWKLPEYIRMHHTWTYKSHEEFMVFVLNDVPVQEKCMCFNRVRMVAHGDPLMKDCEPGKCRDTFGKGRR